MTRNIHKPFSSRRFQREGPTQKGGKECDKYHKKRILIEKGIVLKKEGRIIDTVFKLDSLKYHLNVTEILLKWRILL